MSTINRKDLAFGIIVLAIGVTYLVLTMQLPRKGGIDSTTIPYILTFTMTFLGALQICLVLLRGKRDAMQSQKATPEALGGKDCGTCNPPAPASKPDYATVAITAALIVLYVVFLDYFGFLVMSAAYLLVQISVLTPVYIKKNYLYYVVLSIVVSAFIYYTFLWAFDIMLPHGNLWYDLGIDLEWYPPFLA